MIIRPAYAMMFVVMPGQSLQTSATRDETLDAAAELARLELLLSERQDELTKLQQELQKFKARYTRIVGSQLSELAEIEACIREAEARLQQSDDEAAPEDAEATGSGGVNGTQKAVGGGLRKLFWSVAKLFHPDHASDDAEAHRRHLIMSEATRAYREGDVDSLHTLLGDEDLQFYCAAPGDTSQDLHGRLFQIKEELRTIEFGIKRVKQDGLYRSMLRAESEAANGRDMLADEAARIRRQIAKARHRLTNLT
jgi:hypothetical protein